MKARFFTIALALLVSACGWHLKGNLLPPLDIDSLYISAEAQHTDLQREFERTLKARDITLASSAQTGEYTLALGQEINAKRTVGVGADSLASAYQLSISVNYQLLKHQQPIGKPLTAKVTRSIDANNPTGIEQQQRRLTAAMHRDLVAQILRRIYILLNRQNTQAKSPRPPSHHG